jgi:hypothetical protein
MHSQDIAPSTARSYDGIWRSLIEPKLGSAKLNEITPQAVEAWARKLLKDGTGEASVERAWIVLSGMLGRAASWGWISANQQPQRALLERACGVRTPTLPARRSRG